ncbi:helix-turn-helix transcriptional regulator [Pedobacter sp. BS3]|nr:helix-turn-helix transcriptional regulator [Pedobacter sp. BS3]
MNLLAKGRSYKEIGETLCISTETVRRHLANIYAKLNVKSKVEAINMALGSNNLSW